MGAEQPKIGSNRKKPNNGLGRPRGATNRANRELKAIAGEYTEAAIKALASIMETSESDQARVAAANALLDRAHGKPSQALTGPNGGAVQVTHRIELVGVLPE